MRRKKVNALLRGIYEDKVSGSSILARKLFKILREKSSGVKSKEEFLDFLDNLKDGLKKHHPLLFQLHNLIDVVHKFALDHGVEDIYEGIKEIEDNFNSAGERIAENFLRWLKDGGYNKFSLATLSYSGTVLNSLVYVKEMISKVYVFRSCPGCEGEKMSRRIAGAGLDVFLVNDFALDYVLSDVDLVVSGCDAIFENGDILNKAGTSAIFKLARSIGKETVVLSDSLKIVREKVSYEKILSKSIKTGKAKNVKKVDLIFEIVNSGFICYYITDRGIYTKKDRGEGEIVYSLSEMFSLR